VLNESGLQRLLERYPILHELPAVWQRSIIEAAIPFCLRAGDVIFDGGAPIHSFFFLTSGSIRVSRPGESRDVLLYRVQPGELCMLSVCHLLAGMAYPAVATAEGLVSGATVPQEVIVRLIEGAPLFGRYLFGAISAGLEQLIGLLDAISFYQLDRRLAELLLARGPVIDTTHARLAEDLGSVREVVSRHLKELERRGLVTLARSQIRVINRPALEELARWEAVGE
jgi:CRP/FNR family transcriptional regulator